MSAAIHVKSMEMQTCGLVAKLIVDIDYHVVSNSGCDLWNWPLTVNPNSRTLKNAIRVGQDPCDVEVVGYSRSISQRADQRKKSGRPIKET